MFVYIYGIQYRRRQSTRNVAKKQQESEIFMCIESKREEKLREKRIKKKNYVHTYIVQICWSSERNSTTSTSIARHLVVYEQKDEGRITQDSQLSTYTLKANTYIKKDEKPFLMQQK